MIVKCQRSIAGNEGSRMLFYTKTRRRLWEGASVPEWQAHFGPTTRPDDNRFFAEVKWPDTTQPPTFVRRLPEQDW